MFGLIGGVGLVVVGSLYLRATGKILIGIVLLLVLALPGLAFGFFFLVLILSHARWN